MPQGPDRTPDTQPLSRANGLLLVSNTPKGRGVFASQFIKKGTVVDVSPVLILPEHEVEHHISKTCLWHYTYYWPSASGKSTTQAMALGLGSMFNHSRTRLNVIWLRDFQAQCITYVAYRDIHPGEELCISYGNARLWFDDADGSDDDDYSLIEKTRKEAVDVAEIQLSGLGHIDL